MKKSDLIKLLEPYRDDQEIVVNTNEDGWLTGDIRTKEEFLYPYELGRYGIQYYRYPYPYDTAPAVNVVILQ